LLSTPNHLTPAAASTRIKADQAKSRKKHILLQHIVNDLCQFALPASASRRSRFTLDNLPHLPTVRFCCCGFLPKSRH
jgi:hypothetical protein